MMEIGRSKLAELAQVNCLLYVDVYVDQVISVNILRVLFHTNYR